MPRDAFVLKIQRELCTRNKPEKFRDFRETGPRSQILRAPLHPPLKSSCTYSGVVLRMYPTTPIFSPPTSKTFDLTNRGGERGHLGSWLTFRFDATTVKFKLPRKDTRFSTPSSNSWFPRVWWRETDSKSATLRTYENSQIEPYYGVGGKQ